MSWLLKRAVKENLEFRVDQQMLRSGFDAKNYQYMLVRIGGLHVTLATNFTELTVKKRIGMMNRKPSSRSLIASYGLLLLILIVLIFPKMVPETVGRIGKTKATVRSISNLFQSQGIEVDTPNGTANLVRIIQLKHQKAGTKPPTELILFTKNSAGRGMDVFVKLNGDQIEQARVIALAPLQFPANSLSQKNTKNVK